MKYLSVFPAVWRYNMDDCVMEEREPESSAPTLLKIPRSMLYFNQRSNISLGRMSSITIRTRRDSKWLWRWPVRSSAAATRMLNQARSKGFSSMSDGHSKTMEAFVLTSSWSLLFALLELGDVDKGAKLRDCDKCDPQFSFAGRESSFNSKSFSTWEIFTSVFLIFVVRTTTFQTLRTRWPHLLQQLVWNSNEGTDFMYPLSTRTL